MVIDPFVDAPLAVQIHLVAALEALVLGPVVLYRRRRDSLHKTLGYIWVANVAIAALSSFFITGFRLIGPFSPIHALSVWALWGIWSGVKHARAGRIAAHQATMRSIYWWAMGAAGLLTLLPGRRMNAILFGADEVLGLWVIFAACAVLVLNAAFTVRRRIEK